MRTVFRHLANLLWGVVLGSLIPLVVLGIGMLIKFIWLYA